MLKYALEILEDLYGVSLFNKSKVILYYNFLPLILFGKIGTFFNDYLKFQNINLHLNFFKSNINRCYYLSKFHSYNPFAISIITKFNS